MKYVIWSITVIALVISFIFDKKKSVAALKMAGKRMLKIMPLFFYVMGLTAIVMSALPDKTITNLLGEKSGLGGILLALGLGSATMMPGFVAFTLAAVLKAQGVTYAVLAAFTMTLMNVGVATFPLEKKYLGTKVALIRNGIGFSLAIIITIIVSLVFGEALL